MLADCPKLHYSSYEIKIYGKKNMTFQFSFRILTLVRDRHNWPYSLHVFDHLDFTSAWLWEGEGVP